MDGLLILIPIALGLGLVGLIAFMWSVRSGQFDDLEGAAHRVLFDEEDDKHPAKSCPETDESTATGKKKPD